MKIPGQWCMGLCLGLLASWTLASWTLAQERPRPDAAGGDGELMHPTTQPADRTAPAATQEAPGIPDNVKVSPAARQELEQMGDAYRKLGSLQLAGTLGAHFEVAGKVDNHSLAFKALYAGPGKFNSLSESSLRIGSTGHSVFAYALDRAQYIQEDWPAGKSLLKDMPQPMRQMIEEENPSLALALSGNAAGELLAGIKQVDKGPDVQIGAESCVRLDLTNDTQATQVLLDAQTHLLRRMVVDQTKLLEKRGQVDVKAALVSWDYTTIAVNAEVPAEALAWAPPPEAVDTTAAHAALAAAPGNASAPNALLGKDAPDFTLPALEGKDVALADLKGSVVVLDFWATWCGPCVASLPHLQQVYLDNKAAGVKVFGINLDNDKAPVAPFVKEKKLTFPILLDNGQANVSGKYGAQAIPQTVVIGKDGKVTKVFVGYSNSLEAELRQAIADALHESSHP